MALLDTGRYLVSVTVEKSVKPNSAVHSGSEVPGSRQSNALPRGSSPNDGEEISVFATTLDPERGMRLRSRVELELPGLELSGIKLAFKSDLAKLRACQMYTNGSELAIDNGSTFRVVSLTTGKASTASVATTGPRCRQSALCYDWTQVIRQPFPAFNLYSPFDSGILNLREHSIEYFRRHATQISTR